MAKRYMICPIIGSGTVADKFRAAAEDIPDTGVNALIPSQTSGPNIGKPKYRFGFAIVSTEHLEQVAQISNSFVFPDYSLDGQMSGMEAGAATGMQQNVEAYDLDGQGLHLDAAFLSAESYRQVLDRIGKQIEPAFSIDYFDAN